MKELNWVELQKLLDTDSISEMVENLVDSPSEDNLIMLAKEIIELYRGAK